MRKIGINYQHAEGLTRDEQVKILADAGFSATFTMMQEKAELDALANVFSKYGLAYETIHAPFYGINDIWQDGEAGEKIYQDFADCIESCAMFGVPAMILHMASGLTPPPTTDVGRSRFEKLIEQAEKKNVCLAFENGRKLQHLAWVLEHFADNDTVRMCWDCGHETCFTPHIDFMTLFGNKVSCLHLHDNYGVLNQDSHLLPFDGVIDFEKAAKKIKASGFEGTLMLEVLHYKSEHYSGMSHEQYIQRAAEAAKRLAKMVDE